MLLFKEGLMLSQDQNSGILGRALKLNHIKGDLFLSVSTVKNEVTFDHTAEIILLT